MLAALYVSVALVSFCFMATYLRLSVHLLSIFIASSVAYMHALFFIRELYAVSPLSFTLEITLKAHVSVTIFLIFFIFSIVTLGNDKYFESEWIKNNVTIHVTQHNKLFLFLYITIKAFRVYLALKYDLFAAGSVTEERIMKMSYFESSLSASLLGTINFGLVLWGAALSFKTNNMLCVLFFLFEGLQAFLFSGKTGFMLFCIVFLVGLRFGGARININHYTVVFVAVLAVIYVVSPVLILSRAYIENEMMNNRPAIEATALGIKRSFVSILDKHATLESVSYNNISLRTDAFIFLEQIIEKHTLGADLMYGNAAKRSLRAAVPSIFMSNKPISTEQYIQYHFGIWDHDGAVSIYSLAYADFGLLGCAVYGFVYGAWMLIVSRVFIAISPNALFTAVIIGAMLAQLFIIESEPVASVIIVRDLGILFLLFVFFEAGRRMRRDKYILR